MNGWQPGVMTLFESETLLCALSAVDFPLRVLQVDSCGYRARADYRSRNLSRERNICNQFQCPISFSYLDLPMDITSANHGELMHGAS